MSGTFGVFESDISNINMNYLFNTINPLNLCNTYLIDIDGIGVIGVSSLKDTPLKGDRYFEDNTWIVVFTGDIVDYKTIPYKEIITILRDKKFDSFKKFNGIFSIVAYNKQTTKLFIVSNRLSILPIYYLLSEDSLYFSTEMSTFCRLPIELSFNIEWLWEYLFFNFPLGQTTFLENVRRMPPACILEINIKTGEHLIFKYATKFHKKKRLLKDKKALECAYAVFKNRMPKYFTGTKNIACSLTAGLDSRTNLSFCPNINLVTVYTYGTSRCSDLIEASKTVQKMDIKHEEILFDKKFEEKLPSLMFDTIYLSSGQEHISRSTLLYVYKNLTNCGTKYPLVISGIAFDMLFRGDLGTHTPSLISPDMNRIFSTGEKNINEEFWKEYIGNHYEPFKNHILKKINNLEMEYGKLSTPESHLSYAVYELFPKYFNRELSIAKNFTTLRIPSWDNDIIDLSYSIENSTLSFSQLLTENKDRKRPNRDAIILQAYMINNNKGKLKDIPIYGVPPKTYLSGENKYRLTRAKNLLPKAINIKLTKKKQSPLEDWDRWLNKILKHHINDLIFRENSLINDYINSTYINSLKNKPFSYHSIKLATLEIILRLIKNNWERFYLGELHS